MLDELFRNVLPQFPYLSRQRLVFSIAKRLSTIEHFCFYINHNIPTTFGKQFWVEHSFIYTMVSEKFLRNVPVTRYSHYFMYQYQQICVFYSLGCKHCINF